MKNARSATSILNSSFEILNSPSPSPSPSSEGAAPPIGRTWPRLYVGVLAFLALLIALFYLFTKAFE